MNRQRRPFGFTALAFVSIMIGIYSQIAGIALLLGGTVLGITGSDVTVMLVVLGALFLGLMCAAYFAGYGFWTQRAWSRPVGNVVFGVLIVVSLLLAITSGNVLSAIGPTVGAAAAAWYLNRPATKALLYGAAAATPPEPDEEPKGPVSLEASQPVR